MLGSLAYPPFIRIAFKKIKGVKNKVGVIKVKVLQGKKQFCLCLAFIIW